MSNMTFRRLDGVDQLELERPGQFGGVLELDATLWVAHSVPIDQLLADRRFLELVDTDKNGRIRVDEIRAAVRWTLEVLADPSDLVPGSDRLRLAALDREHPQGRRLLEAARQVLENLGLPDEDAVTLDQVRDRKRLLARVDANGDGVVPPAAIAGDPDAAELAADVLRAMGGVPDVSGATGIDRERLEAFLEAARRHLQHLDRGRRPEVRPFGDATARVHELFERLAPKVEAWLGLCDAARADARIAERGLLANDELASLVAVEWDGLGRRLAELPLARPDPSGRLGREDWINAAWREELLELVDLALDGGPVTRDAWAALGRRLQPHRDWQAEVPPPAVAELGEERLRRWVEDPGPAERLCAVLEADRQVGASLADIDDLERLLLHQRWLWPLLNSSVSFAHFFHPQRRSLLEQGSLYLDGYRLDLCLRVDDPEEHARRARASWLKLAYFEIEGGPTYAAVVTRRGPRPVLPGRRAVFRHVDGRLADACIVHVLDNPVSLSDAVLRPAERAAEYLGTLLQRFTDRGMETLRTSVDDRFDAAARAAFEGARPTPQAASEPGPPPRQGVVHSLTGRELLLGGGVALAAVSSALTYVLDTLSRIRLLDALIPLAALAMLAFLPWLALQAFRLHRRNIATVLEASGWALNRQLGFPRRTRALFVHRPSRVPEPTRWDEDC